MKPNQKCIHVKKTLEQRKDWYGWNNLYPMCWACLMELHKRDNKYNQIFTPPSSPRNI